MISILRGGGASHPRRLLGAGLAAAGLFLGAQAMLVPLKAELAQVLMANAFERALATGEATRPWPWADFSPAARLGFPRQHRSILAVSDASGESLAFGPSLMAASVAPGSPGVAVVAAHRDTHFAFLDSLKPGDPVVVEQPGRRTLFRVTRSEVVAWNASGISPHDGGPARLALVTCWPLTAKAPGPLRYVVWAERAEDAPSPLSLEQP